MNSNDYIIDLLPYQDPFLFVDDISAIDENGVIGHYTFPEDSFFYAGHFIDKPVTPGVILTETMAQIGVVSLGIYLHLQANEKLDELNIAMTSTDIEFLAPVFPGETVFVNAIKKYYRFGKLKCRVTMYNDDEVLVCQGEIAGMIKKLNP